MYYLDNNYARGERLSQDRFGRIFLSAALAGGHVLPPDLRRGPLLRIARILHSTFWLPLSQACLRDSVRFWKGLFFVDACRVKPERWIALPAGGGGARVRSQLVLETLDRVFGLSLESDQVRSGAVARRGVDCLHRGVEPEIGGAEGACQRLRRPAERAGVWRVRAYRRDCRQVWFAISHLRPIANHIGSVNKALTIHIFLMLHGAA